MRLRFQAELKGSYRLKQLFLSFCREVEKSALV